MPAFRGYASALGAAALYGAVFVVIKGLDVHPLTAVATASLVAAVVIAPFVRRLSLTTSDKARLAVSIATGGVAAPMFLFLGLERTTAVEGALLANAEILFTATLAGLVLKERLSRPEWGGFAFLTAGILAITLPPLLLTGGLRPESLVGNALILASALGWALDNTFVTPLTRRHSLLTLLAIKGIVGAVLVAGLVAAMGAPVLAPLDTLPGLAFVGVFGVGLTSLLLLDGFRTIGASRTTVLFSTGALFGVAGGVLVLGEDLAWTHVAGGALMLLGIYLVARGGHAEPPLPA